MWGATALLPHTDTRTPALNPHLHTPLPAVSACRPTWSSPNLPPTSHPPPLTRHPPRPGPQRLHTSHGEPMGDLSITHSHGYCVSFRPADLTPAAALVYHRLVALLNGGSAPQPQSATSSATTLPPASPVVPGPGPGPSTAPYQGPPQLLLLPAMLLPAGTAMPPPFYPSVQPVVAYGGAAGGGGFILVQPPPPHYPHPPLTPASQPVPPLVPAPAPPAVPIPPLPYSGQSYPGAAGPCPMASPLSLHRACVRASVRVCCCRANRTRCSRRGLHRPSPPPAAIRSRRCTLSPAPRPICRRRPQDPPPALAPASRRTGPSEAPAPPRPPPAAMAPPRRPTSTVPASSTSIVTPATARPATPPVRRLQGSDPRVWIRAAQAATGRCTIWTWTR